MKLWKKSFMVALVLGLMVVSGLASKTLLTPEAAKAEDSKERTLEVSGQGVVLVKPDIATISFGVVTRSKDPKVAQTDNAQSMDKVIKSLAALNIKPEDIKTVGYYMNPEINYDKTTAKEKVVGYVVTNMVQVTVRDVAKAGQVLDKVVQEGVNNANGIQFGISEEKRTQFYHQALQAALKSAKDKANIMAKSMEIQIGTPKRIMESGGEAPIIMREKQMVFDQAAVSSATPIAAGELEIRANVGLVYTY